MVDGCLESQSGSKIIVIKSDISEQLKTSVYLYVILNEYVLSFAQITLGLYFDVYHITLSLKLSKRQQKLNICAEYFKMVKY